MATLKLTFSIKPATPGLIVRDPITMEPLAEAGEEKPRNAFWQKRYTEGDVIDVPKQPAKRSPKSASKNDASPKSPAKETESKDK